MSAAAPPAAAPLAAAPLAAALVAAALAAACGPPASVVSGATAPAAASRSADGAAGGEAAPWVRDVAPFPVTGPQGVPYAQPFLGGFNLPRPQLVDIDADGDDDLFVQEATGSVMFFERTAREDAPFLWRTDRFGGLDVGEWYRFVDLDLDGDMDLLAEQPFSYIRYYRNDGGPGAPVWVEAADSLRDVDGRPLFSDRQNIPNATDLDCDGRVDLLIGRLVGTISHYEMEGTGPDGAPRFRLLTDRFEDIEIVAQFGSAHGANTMALGDVDDDGDQDLFWGDYFERGLLFIENRGSCRAPSLRGQPRQFPPSAPLLTSGYNAPTVGDVDDDGDADLVVGVLGGAFNPNTTTIDNLHRIEQVAPGRWETGTSRLIPTLDVGSESVPAVVDADGDGDLDVLVSNKITQDDPENGAVHLFRNEGRAGAPELVWAGTLDLFGGGYHVVPAFGDLDGDGDADALVGTWRERVRYLRNEGGRGIEGLVMVDSAFVTLTRGRNAVPALGDVDGDGDLDLVVGESSGQLNFYRNEGTVTRPRFELVSDRWMDVDVGRRSVPALEDVDGDGDLDLVVGSESEGLHLYRNDGDTRRPRWVEAGVLRGVSTFGHAAPAFADLDGDGDRDLLLGGTGGGVTYFRRR